MSSTRPRNATGESFFAWDGDTRIVNILGKPAASKDAIGKPLRIRAPKKLPAVFPQ